MTSRPPGITHTTVYLGDGLYADYDGYQIRLFSHDGIQSIATVYLDPTVTKAFRDYIDRLDHHPKRKTP